MLPKIYACKVDSDGNNKEVFYGDKKELIDSKSINQKLDEIFSSSDYIYKADVVITLREGLINRNIIGRNRNNLITMDNELIPIDNILDIQKK